MASDFQRPMSWMALGSTSAQRSAVAPPGRRLRAVSLSGSMPVCDTSCRAECCRALVISRGVA